MPSIQNDYAIFLIYILSKYYENTLLLLHIMLLSTHVQ